MLPIQLRQLNYPPSIIPSVIPIIVVIPTITSTILTVVAAATPVASVVPVVILITAAAVAFIISLLCATAASCCPAPALRLQLLLAACRAQDMLLPSGRSSAAATGVVLMMRADPVAEQRPAQ